MRRPRHLTRNIAALTGAVPREDDTRAADAFWLCRIFPGMGWCK